MCESILNRYKKIMYLSFIYKLFEAGVIDVTQGNFYFRVEVMVRLKIYWKNNTIAPLPLTKLHL